MLTHRDHFSILSQFDCLSGLPSVCLSHCALAYLIRWNMCSLEHFIIIFVVVEAVTGNKAFVFSIIGMNLYIALSRDFHRLKTTVKSF